MSRSEHATRPPHAYSEDDNTIFSEPTYQQQTFPQGDFAGSYDMQPHRQGEESLWSNHSTAFDSTDGLAGVGQALHVADAFADRTGSVDAYALLDGYDEPGCAAMDCRPTALMPHFYADQPAPDTGQFYASSLQLNQSSGLQRPSISEVEERATAVQSPTALNTSDGEGPLRCTMCDKSVRRPCELKYVGTSSSQFPGVTT